MNQLVFLDMNLLKAWGERLGEFVCFLGVWYGESVQVPGAPDLELGQILRLLDFNIFGVLAASLLEKVPDVVNLLGLNDSTTNNQLGLELALETQKTNKLFPIILPTTQPTVTKTQTKNKTREHRHHTKTTERLPTQNISRWTFQCEEGIPRHIQTVSGEDRRQSNRHHITRARKPYICAPVMFTIRLRAVQALKLSTWKERRQTNSRKGLRSMVLLNMIGPCLQSRRVIHCNDHTLKDSTTIHACNAAH